MATAFDIGGLLGSAFGGSSALEDLLTEQQKAAIRQQGALSAAAALLQAAGPSTTRSSLGQALGSAFAAGQAGTQKAQESALTQMLTRQKLDEARRAQGLQKSIADILTGGTVPTAPAAGGTVTAEEALAAPGMPVGPTVERAALIGQPRPAAPAPELSANEVKARQYRQIADVYTAAGKGEEAKRFMDIAENLAPSRQKVQGQPFEVTDAQGKPVMVQQFEDGSVRTLPGFGPRREVVLQTVDGKVQAIDKSKLAGGETYGTGMSPAERERLNIEREQLRIAQQRLGLSQAEFNRGAYDRVETAQGIMYVPKTPGFQAIPVTDAQGKPLMGSGGKPTEGESNAAGFAQRMERADMIISRLPPAATPGPVTATAGAIPLVGGIAQRIAESPEQQQYRQAANDWIRAKLRKESGAAIGVDEMQREFETYFPQVGDEPATIAQKARARAVATQGMARSAGRAYQAYTPQEGESPRQNVPQEGAVAKDRQGRDIVFRNGQWVYQ
jgi:hypothetical protein